MKQKSLIKPQSIPDLILNMIRESDLRADFLLSNSHYCLDDIDRGFDVVGGYNHYFKLAEQGLLTQEIEDRLVAVSQEIPDVNFPHQESIEDYARFNVWESLPALLDLFSYYCAMAMYFHLDKKPRYSTAYAYKAKEADGQAYQIGLHYYIVNAVQINAANKAVEVGIKRDRKQKGKEGSIKRLTSPNAIQVKEDWKMILECYDDWKLQKNQTRYSSDVQFIKDMKDKVLKAKPSVQYLKRQLAKR